MAISRVQSAVATANSTSVTVTMGSATAASGNLLIAHVTEYSTDTITMTGWTLAASATSSGGANTTKIFWRESNGASSYTASRTGSGGITLRVTEYSGVDLTSGVDASGTIGGNDSSGSVSTSGSTTAASELAFVAFGIGGGRTITGSPTNSFAFVGSFTADPSGNSGCQSAEKFTTTTGVQTSGVTFSGFTTYSFVIVTFKAAAGGGGSTAVPNSLMMMGFGV